MSLLWTAIRNNWSAQRSTPINLLMGVFGMAVNNAFLIVGLYLMIFSGKVENAPYKSYFWAAQFMTMTAWGALNFFVGGFRELGRLIENGSFENYLAAPRHSLLLAGVSSSDVSALGDFIFGIVGNIALIFMFDVGFAMRTALATLMCAAGLLASFILAGGLAFYVARGASLGELFYQITLSLSVYPSPAILTGRSRIALYVTPALVTALLPLESIMEARLSLFLLGALVTLVILGISVLFFNRGVRNYQSANYIFLRE